MRAFTLALLCCASPAARAADAILHIGPHKTGSTTLEAAVIMQPFVRNSLEEHDGFARTIRGIPGRFQGAKAHANLADALMSLDMDTHPAWAWFLAYAKKAATEGRHIFVSSENLSVVPSETNLRRLVALLADDLGFHVRVVICYRWLFDKLPSVHSELYMAEYRPVTKVRDYRPIVDWITEGNAHVSSRFHQTVRLREQWKRLGAAEVAVVDINRMSNATSLVADFICNQLRAAVTCGKMLARHGSLAIKNVRPRLLSPLYDIAYGVAAEQGVTTLDPQRAVKALQSFNLQTQVRIPTRCPTASQLERIWRATIYEEERLTISAPFGQRDESSLRGNFEARRSLLCSADVSAVLKMPEFTIPLAIAVQEAAVPQAATS
ncbi:hypothetical protein T492DRAFT_841778 [Pavlovales sp. CCMP2436]|nr:hypothetical protein T492DRAFT_841778 [Pavlovales sp. CCMP2436]